MTVSDWLGRGGDVSNLKVSAIADKFSLVRYQDILYTNRGMMGPESPLVSPQKIRFVNILSGFQSNAFFYQGLMGRICEFGIHGQQNGQ